MINKSILYSLTLLFGLSHCGPKEDKSPQSRFKLDMRDYIIREDSSLVHKKDLQISKKLNQLCSQVFQDKHLCSENIKYGFNPRIRSLGLMKIPVSKVNMFLQELQHLDSLHTLSLDRISLKSLPDLSKLTGLTSLSLLHLNLTDTVVIPQYLSNLRSLDIIKSKFKWIVFPENCRIRSLRLYKNEINYLNKSFYYLEDLENLNLRENPLFDVIDLNRFPKLKTVNLCGTATRPYIRERIKKQYPHIKFDFCPDEIEVIFEDDEQVKQ